MNWSVLAYFLINSLLFFIALEISLRYLNFPKIHLSARRREQQFHALILKLKQTRSSIKNTYLATTPSDCEKIATLYHDHYFLGDITESHILLPPEDDGVIHYDSDENGFRNPKHLYNHPQGIDVVLLGDSFTDGYAVPDGFTIADGLRQKTHLHIYNAGKCGAGLLHSLAVYIEYIRHQKVKNVALLITEGIMINRFFSEINNEFLRPYFIDFINAKKNLVDLVSQKNLSLMKYHEAQLNQHLKKRSLMRSLLSHIKYYCRSFLFESNISLLIKQITKVNFGYTGEKIPNKILLEREWDTLKKYFDMLNQDCLENGMRFFVVLVPNARFYFNHFPDDEVKCLTSLCKDLDIDFLNLIPSFAAQKNPKNLMATPTTIYNQHLSKEGCLFVAGEIASHLACETQDRKQASNFN